MRKEAWAAVTAMALLSDLSIAAELRQDETPVITRDVKTGPVVYLRPETRVWLLPNCSESYSAILLRCPRLVYLYPPYDLGAVIQLKTLPPRNKWRPYNQLFSWSRY
jgi:hypothetical protein